jgi:hypothetical protein
MTRTLPLMDEQAAFEARAVIAPRRARLSRLALLGPVLALVATAWAGWSARPDHDVAVAPNASAHVAPSIAGVGSSPAVAPQPRDLRFPAQVLGLEVHRLGDIEARGLSRDTLNVVAGWYATTAIADCPPLAAVFRTSTVPELGNPVDEWRFCKRSGLFFASGPNLEDSRALDGERPAIPVILAPSAVVPPQLEIIGTPATPVVVIGRFVNTDEACPLAAGCRVSLYVDHVAWTPSS